MLKIRNWLATLTSIIKYPSIVKRLDKSEGSIYFFFPFYHIGGAERVHLDILSSVNHKNPVCFITDSSINNDLKAQYIKNSTLIELFRWGRKKSFKKHMQKKIAVKINKANNAVVFGCNSHFFYDLLPLLKKDVKKIDLIHAFIGDNSFEEWSLPLIPLIDKRIVLGPKHVLKLASYYSEKNINEEYLKRVLIIPNKVEIPTNFSKKSFENNLTVLFIARDSPEKRIPVFLKVASKCEELGLPFIFTMIGDFENYRHELTKNVNFIPRIKDKSQLNLHYAKSHLVMLTSSYEGFPMVLLEGMALGNIPIITDVGEVSSWVNESSGTGFIVENYSDTEHLISGFVDKLTFIANHKELLPEMSMNVINLIKKSFNEESFTKKYRDLLILK